ncbi:MULTISPECIES: DUF262 domain-containing protein [unclassified Microcoleus]|uniref:DUF262 domain-containing protein n=1 Tax=unclassified Microcoleus TaxID=2642155 RepID=UPI002FD2AA21
MSVSNYLIPGETFSIGNQSDLSQSSLSDQEINEKYKRGEIRIVTEQARYPLDSIQTMLDSKQGDSKKYILNPEYQRRKRWDNTRKSRLIESFIMNVPIPPIFLYEVDYSIYEVMDGQQRLTTIYDFYKGRFELKGLEYWQELNGKRYDDLPEQVRRGIDRRYLSSIVLLEETAKTREEAESLKRIVFERLNSGGEKLTPQETRNALHNGKFNQLCMKLAKNDLFRKMWQLPLESQVEDLLLKSEEELKQSEFSARLALYRKMEDVELVLRFFAYRHLDKLKSPIDGFLDDYLRQANSWSDKVLNDLESVFNETIELVYTVFGETAFLAPSRSQESKTPRKSVYDPLMQVFSRNLKSKNRIIENAETIKETRYSDDKLLFSKRKNRHIFDGRYGDRKDVENRIEYFNEFLQSYI